MSQKQKTQSAYAAKGRFAINRKAKLERHLKKHPNDEQGVQALRANKTTSSRKKPISKLGWIGNNELGAKIRGRFIGGITKEFATKYAQVLRLCRKAQFQLTPVVVPGPNNTFVVEQKHLSKKSNFKEVKEDGKVVIHA